MFLKLSHCFQWLELASDTYETHAQFFSKIPYFFLFFQPMNNRITLLTELFNLTSSKKKKEKIASINHHEKSSPIQRRLPDYTV